MLKFVVLLSFVACALGAAIPEGMLPQLDGRIVGGTATSIGEFPFQISLQRNGGHSCGGSIYNNRIIMTAAHCLQGGVSASILRIRAGSSNWNSGGVVIQVASYKNHEGYNANTMVNDVAIVRLSSSLTYSSNIRNIGLSSSLPGNGAALVVTGWGTLSSGGSAPSVLQKVTVNYVTPANCRSSSYGYGSAIKDGMICAAAAGKDSCQGDSGGPLTWNGVLLGIVSWGNGCANSRYPGVYASVPTYRSWIINNA